MDIMHCLSICNTTFDSGNPAFDDDNQAPTKAAVTGETQAQARTVRTMANACAQETAGQSAPASCNRLPHEGDGGRSRSAA